MCDGTIKEMDVVLRDLSPMLPDFCLDFTSFNDFTRKRALSDQEKS